MSSTEKIAKLRAELAGLSGQTRFTTLVQLGQTLAEQYSQAGPGNPTALPGLNDAIEAYREAYGYMAADDGLRGHVGSMYGYTLCTRYTAHMSAPEDLETGIHVLEDALTATNLPPFLRTMDLLMLGQFRLSRVTSVLQSPDVAMKLMTGNLPPESGADADWAVECFRGILENPMSDDIATAAESMLAMAETMQALFGGPRSAGLDMGRMMEAMAKVQQLQARFGQGGTPAPVGSFFSFEAFKNIVSMPSLDRPVTVVEQFEQPIVEPAQVRRPQPAPAAVATRDDLRRSLHELLSSTGTSEQTWALAAALLDPGAPAVSVDIVDEAVALARMTVEPEDPDDASAAVDWFVLSVALYLRNRLDEGADRLAGAESLLTAVRKVPLSHPGAVKMLQALGAFLDEDAPFDSVLHAVADGFAERLDDAIKAPPTDDRDALASLYTLRCLCRAADAMAVLRGAADATPAGYPWLTPLKAAARITG